MFGCNGGGWLWWSGGEGESSCSVNRSDCDRCNVAIRFGLSSPTPHDQTVFTVRTNFTSPEGWAIFTKLER